MDWPFTFEYKRKKYEIYDSLYSVRESKVFLVINNEKKEITEISKKRTILDIARSIKWEQIGPPRRKTPILYAYNHEEVKGNFVLDSHVRILDRIFYYISNKDNDDSYFCLELEKPNTFLILGDYYDKDGYLLNVANKKELIGFDETKLGKIVINKIIDIFKGIDEEFGTNHPKYTEQRIYLILNRGKLI